MALPLKTQAALGLHRFGFGPRAGTMAAIAADPRGAILAELDRAHAGELADPDLLTSAEATRAVVDWRQERKAERLAQRAEQEMAKAAPPVPPPAAAANVAGEAAAAAAPGADPERNPAPKRDPGPGLPQQIYLEEAKVRFDAALAAEIGLAERLVWFWSNHFCISADKVRPRAGAFEREAIRPHVVGRFADMLAAVEQHPAMLVYLDNAGSVGPNSPAGRNRGRGLNENLAREILELHTLGVNGGYSQDDVTSFARVLTGWTVVPPKNNPERGGEFVFNPRLHEPGAARLLGRDFAEDGREQGRAVLAALAQHPATARHVTTKLARHFLSAPSSALLDSLARRFLDTDGDLREVTRALLQSEEAWGERRDKLKRPGEWMVAALRATGVTPPDVRPLLNAQALLGEPLWRPPAPKGFSDADADWSDGISQRVDVANGIARRLAALVDPDAVIDAALGPLASAATRETVHRAESRPQALTLVLMAPEFLRR